jgi:hypothetical protein
MNPTPKVESAAPDRVSSSSPVDTGEDAASAVRTETSPQESPGTASPGLSLLPSRSRAEGTAGHLRKLSKKRKRGFPELLTGELANFANKLDMSTAEMWLSLCRLRAANFSPEMVCKSAGMDGDLYARIISSPTFMGFEAIYRKVHLATPELDIAARQIVEAQIEANETLFYWMRERDIRTAHLSLAAATKITDINLATMRPSKRRIGMRVDLTDDQRKRFEIAIEE